MTTNDRVRRSIKAATDLASAHQRDIAADVGVSPLTLSHWRNGRRNPTPSNLMELGRVLLERARSLERVAHDLLRLAQEEERRHARSPERATAPEALDLFDATEEGAA